MQEEKEKPMFENINKNSNYGTFSNNSRKLSNKKNKITYTHGKLTRMQNSYAQLKTTSRLPSVVRGASKTSLDYINKTTSRQDHNGAQTQRAQRSIFSYTSPRPNQSK